MKSEFFVSLLSIIVEMSFKEVFLPRKAEDIKVYSPYIIRLGLALIGSLDKFNSDCVLIMGQSEEYFLSTLSSEEISRAMDAIFSKHPPALVVSRNICPRLELVEAAKRHGVAVLVSKESATYITSELTPFLSLHLAPRITRSGGLMNVHGEGIFIIGESGIGKSETAIELLKRGHKLVSDDLVEIRRLPQGKLVGTSPDNTRYFVEVRGIGIINARRIFGVGAVKPSENIDLVINLSHWRADKQYDRMGLNTKHTEIMDVKVPYYDVPVRPGRNLAVIVEIAAMNNRQRKLGYNAAKELFVNLGMEYDDIDNDYTEKCIFDL